MGKEINTYIICSTLNQMVNYLPLSIFSKHGLKDEEDLDVNIKKIYNITIIGENEKNFKNKRFHNEKWDRNFKNVVEETFKDIKIESIEISRNKSLSIECIYDDIMNNLESEDIDKPILWNITGGQRNLLMGIYKIIENRKGKGDKILYLEGNSNKMMILGNSDNEETGKILPSIKYFDDNLDIETALNLAGLMTKESKKVEKRNNLLKRDLDKKYIFFDKYKKYLDLYNLYVGKEKKGDEKNLKVFRNIILRLNKKKNGTDWEDVKKHLNEKFNVSKFEQKSIEEIGEEIKQNPNPLGHILECMTVAVILKCLNDNEKLGKYFVDMAHGENIRFKDKGDYINAPQNSLFEFDIVLLSGSGQMIIFECKSGVMLGETAKARKYSVYAAGGVYGKPIIITPLLQNQIENIDNECKSAKENLEKDDKETVYSTLKTTINSAKRADMEVWGIDKIKSKLEQMFKDVWEV